MLPKNERLTPQQADTYIKGLIYGAPFSGKTTFLDKTKDPLNINTDGNLKYVTMQRVLITDTYEGRVKIFAWENFKRTIAELQSGTEFKTIIVDLVEDIYEMCRLYVYDKYGFTHESDEGFGKGYDKVRTEFLSTMRAFTTLPYNIFIISHEVAANSKGANGEEKTIIRPNLPYKICSKLAGMVDFVARTVVDAENNRWLQLKMDGAVFGGGRVNFTQKAIKLDFDEFKKIYIESTGGTK